MKEIIVATMKNHVPEYPYKVVGKSALVNVDSDFHSAELASDLYMSMRDSNGIYSEGYIMSNLTGELFCHFSWEEDSCGKTFTEWHAKG